jgi:NADH-quinone oxidoreductase subunit M
MSSWPILSITTFLPILGVLFIFCLNGDDEVVRRNARWAALWTTLVTFAVSLMLVWRFDPSSPEFQFVEKRQWLAGLSSYHMGVDGISLPFVILTTALLPFCIIASWKAIMYSLTRSWMETQLASTHSGIRNVVRITNSIEMPSTPIW